MARFFTRSLTRGTRTWLRHLPIAAAALALLQAGCSKKDDDDGATSGTVVSSTGGTNSGDNGLASAYPGSLALAVFPQGDGAALALTQDVEDPNEGKTVQEKLAENDQRLKGELPCLDPEQFRSLKQAASETCYEFDSDMNPHEVAGQSQTFGTVDGKNSSGEACMVAFARAEVADAVQTVDRALALVSGMLCQANKDGMATDLPGAGETLDFAASFAHAAGVLIEVSEAKLTRLDDLDGKAVYRSDVAVVGPEGEGFEVHLVHSPSTDGNDAGTLWFKRTSSGDLQAGQEQDPNNSANKNDVMSINYANSSVDGARRVRFEVRRASIVNTIEPFTSDGLVDYGALSANAQNAEVHAIKYVAFDMDPETNAGDLSYWMNPGGAYGESARGFLFNVQADADGKLVGCGVSGATQNVSIRKALTEPSTANVLAPVRYWHPQWDDNIHADKDARYDATEGMKITQQCFKQSAAGLYEVDTDVTSHERGYDVLASGASEVGPPVLPELKLEGGFKPAE